MNIWYALARLRCHTETTLAVMAKVTTHMGSAIRRFARETRRVDTRELPSEEAARGRRDNARAAAQGVPPLPRINEDKQKTFNLHFYKLHHIGHTVSDIWNLGTTDNFSTQTVCNILSHRTEIF